MNNTIKQKPIILTIDCKHKLNRLFGTQLSGKLRIKMYTERYLKY